MSEPEEQKQHKISKVYLKAFSFEKDGFQHISVLNLPNHITTYEPIEKFSVEINIFDLPFEEFEGRRSFENLSSKIEDHYPTILSNLQHQGWIPPKDRGYLVMLISNFLCRTSPFRDSIQWIIDRKELREKLAIELTSIVNKKDRQFLLEHLQKLKSEYSINIVMSFAMGHLSEVLSKFKIVTLRPPEGHHWITTDSPVVLDKRGHHDRLLPWESELLFPLSPKYCAFLFHPNSSPSKPTSNLRELSEKKVQLIDQNLFDKLSLQIGRNFSDFIVFAGDVGIQSMK